MHVRTAQGVPLNTRPAYAAPIHEVVDIIREGRLALVVCVKCGATWDEGSEPPQCTQSVSIGDMFLGRSR